MSTLDLLGQRKYWPLFWTQFLGALNDNAFKNALVILITFGVAADAEGGLSSAQKVALTAGLFVLPFFLFSALAGQLADKYDKARLVRLVKVAELPIMLLGGAALVLQHVVLGWVALFLMGLQSTFFGPLKYSALPELLEPDELVAGNALIEMGTFLAILIGTVLGGILIGVPGSGPWAMAAVVVVLAAVGYACARQVVTAGPAAPDLRVEWGVVQPTWRLLQVITRERSILHGVLGISWFWLLGAVVLSILPGLVTEYLGGSESMVTYLLVLFSVGVGAGSLVCEKLSFRQLELGLVPLGSLGMSVFLLDTALTLATLDRPATGNLTEFVLSASGLRLTLDLSLFAFSSGLFIVPLYTFLQERSSEQVRSRVIAANNVMNAAFMVAGSLLLSGLLAAHATIAQILVVLTLMNLAVAVYIYTVIPEFLFRFVCFCLAHVLYRIRVEGREHIPLHGPALLVCNHVTFVDWLILSSASPRPIRFVMHYAFTKLPGSGRIFRDAKVIPIASAKEDPALLAAAFRRISEELRQGELVCIFPEGKLTTDGTMAVFRRGVERILEADPVPVVPMHLGGLWQSVFSRHTPRRPFRRVWSRIWLRVGAPLSPGEATAENLEQRVRELGGVGQGAAELRPV